MESFGGGCDHILWNMKSLLLYLMEPSRSDDHVRIVILRNRNKHYNTQKQHDNKKSNNIMQVGVAKRIYFLHRNQRNINK